MMLFVTFTLIGVAVSVSAVASDGECFLHKVFESFSNEKVKLALTERDVKDLKKDFAKLKKNIYEIPKTNQDCKYPVAFFAKNTNHRPVTGGQTLTYDTIVTDTCQTFDRNTGTFICPKDGVYIFHFNALNMIGKVAGLDLYKNDSLVIRMWTDDKASFESGGNTALLQLKKGDKIYVKVHVGVSVTLHGQCNTFSGHIIAK